MISFYQKNFKLGILGGGQLGRMLIQEAIDFDIRVHVLDPSSDAPCSAIANKFVQGDFNDYETVVQFGNEVDVITIEIENVNVDALEALEKLGKKVYPSPAFLRMVKDKGLQKKFYQEKGIPTSDFELIASSSEISPHHRFPFVQKLRVGGYDGKGVQIIKSVEDLHKAFTAPSVIEELVDFSKEISVITARNASGEVKSFPLVEMEFNTEANLVEFLFSPANVSSDIEEKARQIAEAIVTEANFVGLLAVEMFVEKNGNILVNEIAPRPHNSGHHTIEACTTSQYAQHLRAIMNMPLGETRLVQPAAMINLLGEKDFIGPVKYDGLETALALPGVHLHLYGKSETKPFRKMGHVTITAQTLAEAQEIAHKVNRTVKVIS